MRIAAKAKEQFETIYLYREIVSEAIRVLMPVIAAAVRGPPEQFYFEREILDELYTPWEPARTELLLAPHRSVERAYNQPVRREKRPGPNEPCFCGSGRKYKKCRRQ